MSTVCTINCAVRVGVELHIEAQLPSSSIVYLYANVCMRKLCHSTVHATERVLLSAVLSGLV